MLNIIVALVVIAVLYVVVSRKNALPNLPPFKGAFPFFGCFIDFGKSPIGCLRAAYDKYGDCFTLKMLGHDMTYFLGPEATGFFFRQDDEQLSPKEAYKMMVPVFGKGVVYDSPTEVMYEQLRFVRSAISLATLKKAVPIIYNETKEYFDRKWGDEGQIDLLEELNKLTILTASRCLMGESIRKHLGENNEHIAHLYHELEQGINPISFFFPGLPLPGFKRRDAARDEIANIFKSIIKDRRDSNDTESDDIMATLMRSEYKDGTTLEDDQLAGLMIALLFAGQHTSSITATWAGLLMFNQKQYLDEAMEEMKQVNKENNGVMDYEFIKKQVKLENNIREALRMYPPLIILMRKVLQDLHYKSPITNKEYHIPAGHIACVSPGASMRLNASFKNPDVYDPHRFERGEVNAADFAFIAFGGGKHGCPGERFGVLQIKTIWNVILSTYELKFSGVPPPDYASLVAGPKGPILVSYKKRATPLL